MSCKMVIHWPARSKYQSFTCYAACLCLLPEIVGRSAIVFKEPQYAPIDPRQQSHPNAERRRRQLVVVVEAAEHEAILSQSKLLPRQDAVRNYHAGVVRLVAVWNTCHLLTQTWQHLFRYYRSVCENIVQKARTRRCWKTQIA